MTGIVRKTVLKVDGIEDRLLAGRLDARRANLGTLRRDLVRLKLYIMALDIAEGIRPYIMGEYDDTLVRVDGRWKFRERNVTLCAGKSWLQGALTK